MAKKVVISSKQKRMIAYIETHPGATAADLHRAIGREYSHGHHKFTYDSVKRLVRNKTITRTQGTGGRMLLNLSNELKKL